MTVKDVLVMLYGIDTDEVLIRFCFSVVDDCPGTVSDVYHHDAYGWSEFKVSSFVVHLGDTRDDYVLYIDLDVDDYRRRLEIA